MDSNGCFHKCKIQDHFKLIVDSIPCWGCCDRESCHDMIFIVSALAILQGPCVNWNMEWWIAWPLAWVETWCPSLSSYPEKKQTNILTYPDPFRFQKHWGNLWHVQNPAQHLEWPCGVQERSLRSVRRTWFQNWVIWPVAIDAITAQIQHSSHFKPFQDLILKELFQIMSCFQESWCFYMFLFFQLWILKPFSVDVFVFKKLWIQQKPQVSGVSIHVSSPNGLPGTCCTPPSATGCSRAVRMPEGNAARAGRPGNPEGWVGSNRGKVKRHGSTLIFYTYINIIYIYNYHAIW